MGQKIIKYTAIGVLVLVTMCWLMIKPVMAADALHNYHRLIIFGDSYSDNGNVYRLTHQVIPNSDRYYQGRFSNGPVWAEYFAQYLGLDPKNLNEFVDMAYGGAKIFRPVKEIIHGKPRKFYIVPNLAQQIDFYLKQEDGFRKDDLVVVFMGTNDYIPLFHLNPQAFFTQRADQETIQINRLIEKGAEHMIVFNVRNLSYLPLLQRLKEKHYFPVNYVANYYDRYLLGSITAFNLRLETNLKATPQIFIYNIFNFDTLIFSKLQKNSFAYSIDHQQYAFKMSSIPCYANYKKAYQYIAGLPCKKPEEFFFYDRIHTTSNVNYLLAQDVYNQFFQQPLK